MAHNFTLGVAIPHTTCHQQWHARANVTMLSGLKDCTDPLKRPSKKKANTMITNFPKNVTRHRASDMTVTMPLGATFKRREKPNRFVRASGCSSARQVRCTAHRAGDPPHEGCTVLATCVLALPGKLKSLWN